jgi:hypothetical protein
MQSTIDGDDEKEETFYFFKLKAIHKGKVIFKMLITTPLSANNAVEFPHLNQR